MKKFLCIPIMILTCIFFLFPGCGEETAIETSDTSSAIQVPLTYTLYIDETLSPDGEWPEAVREMQAWIYTDPGNVKAQREDNEAPGQITKIVAGKTFSLTKETSYEGVDGLTPAKAANGNCDRYVQEDSGSRIQMEIRREDGAILYLADTSADQGEGDVTLTEAVEIAERILAELYGQELADKYVCLATQEGDPSSGGLGMHAIAFVREVEGYRTDDSITVFVTTGGEVFGVNARSLGYADTIAEAVTADMVDKAQKELEEQFSNFTLQSASLVLGDDGRCYLKQGLLSPGGVAYHIYINVN